MRRLVASSVVACALVAPAPALLAAPVEGGLQRVTADSTGGDATPGVYVVMLAQAPLASYRGDLPAFPATVAPHARRFDANRPAVTAYRGYLQQQQDDVLADIGDPPVLYRYTTAVNGFAADLTSEQVKALRIDPDVALLQRSETLHLASTARRAANTVDSDDRPWKALGPARDAGDGVVIGVIDSGIWPENPSFDGVPLDATSRAEIYPGFTGRCEAGDRWQAELCDSKVLAASYFVGGFGTDRLAAREYLSARDAIGHGSHTAATAAGNPGVAVTIDAQPFGRISGVAPAAGLAVYKACWTAPDPEDDGCTIADTVAAIDRAVSDGVDVLSHSITGVDQSPDDVVAQAFLNASESGVFVSAAAGDDGPQPGTVDHVSPWVTTAAASTQDIYRGRLRLGDGTVIPGTMTSTNDVASTRIVRAADVAAPDAAEADAALCLPGSLDSTAVEGTIVICDRGTSSRVDKGRSAERAGAAAMVLANVDPGDVPADVHTLPAMHVSVEDRGRLLEYLDTADVATASLQSAGSPSSAVPTVASFSSRGPSPVSGADVLKPDITAPGVNVLSAVAPTSSLPRIWDLMSGTSMSAPYVAGMAALVADLHPDWSAAAIKSALLTTAQPVADAGPFAAGAGLVRPAALDPGLVYDTEPADWRRFLAGDLTGQQLNQPSIAVSRLVGAESVLRTVTNVGSRAETFSASFSGLRGLSVAVDPQQVRLAPGESAQVEVAFTAKRTARYGQYARGLLTWTGSRGHVATSPVVVRPEFVAAPADVTASVSADSTIVRVRAGVTGQLRTSVVGPAPSEQEPFTLEPGSFDPTDPNIDSSSRMRLFLVPPGATVARFQADAVYDVDDIDLYVYRGGRLVATAVSAAGDERITLRNPRPGLYSVYLNSAASALEDATTPGTFSGWVLGDAPSGRLTVTPDPVTVTGGRPFGLRASWSGLDPNHAWFGYVTYGGSNTRTYITLR